MLLMKNIFSEILTVVVFEGDVELKDIFIETEKSPDCNHVNYFFPCNMLIKNW